MLFLFRRGVAYAPVARGAYEARPSCVALLGSIAADPPGSTDRVERGAMKRRNSVGGGPGPATEAVREGRLLQPASFLGHQFCAGASSLEPKAVQSQAHESGRRLVRAIRPKPRERAALHQSRHAEFDAGLAPDKPRSTHGPQTVARARERECFCADAGRRAPARRSVQRRLGPRGERADGRALFARCIVSFSG